MRAIQLKVGKERFVLDVHSSTPSVYDAILFIFLKYRSTVPGTACLVGGNTVEVLMPSQVNHVSGDDQRGGRAFV